jgi:hypothetical protein
MFIGLVTGVTGKTPPGYPHTPDRSTASVRHSNDPNLSKPIRRQPNPSKAIRGRHFFSQPSTLNRHTTPASRRAYSNQVELNRSKSNLIEPIIFSRLMESNLGRTVPHSVAFAGFCRFLQVFAQTCINLHASFCAVLLNAPAAIPHPNGMNGTHSCQSQPTHLSLSTPALFARPVAAIDIINRFLDHSVHVSVVSPFGSFLFFSFFPDIIAPRASLKSPDQFRHKWFLAISARLRPNLSTTCQLGRHHRARLSIHHQLRKSLVPQSLHPSSLAGRGPRNPAFRWRKI